MNTPPEPTFIVDSNETGRVGNPPGCVHAGENYVYGVWPAAIRGVWRRYKVGEYVRVIDEDDVYQAKVVEVLDEPDEFGYRVELVVESRSYVRVLA